MVASCIHTVEINLSGVWVSSIQVPWCCSSTETDPLHRVPCSFDCSIPYYHAPSNIPSGMRGLTGIQSSNEISIIKVNMNKRNTNVCIPGRDFATPLSNSVGRINCVIEYWVHVCMSYPPGLLIHSQIHGMYYYWWLITHSTSANVVTLTSQNFWPLTYYLFAYGFTVCSLV